MAFAAQRINLIEMFAIKGEGALAALKKTARKARPPCVNFGMQASSQLEPCGPRPPIWLH
jgi:hypothetical protein